MGMRKDRDAKGEQNFVLFPNEFLNDSIPIIIPMIIIPITVCSADYNVMFIFL